MWHVIHREQKISEQTKPTVAKMIFGKQMLRRYTAFYVLPYGDFIRLNEGFRPAVIVSSDRFAVIIERWLMDCRSPSEESPTFQNRFNEKTMLKQKYVLEKC